MYKIVYKLNQQIDIIPRVVYINDIHDSECVTFIYKIKEHVVQNLNLHFIAADRFDLRIICLSRDWHNK